MRGSEDVLERLEAQDRELMTAVRIFAKRRMKESGTSQRQLARDAQVSPATISTWLRGHSELDDDSLIRVCGAVDSLRPHAATASVLRKAEAMAVANRSKALAATG